MHLRQSQVLKDQDFQRKSRCGAPPTFHLDPISFEYSARQKCLPFFVRGCNYHRGHIISNTFLKRVTLQLQLPHRIDTLAICRNLNYQYDQCNICLFMIQWLQGKLQQDLVDPGISFEYLGQWGRIFFYRNRGNRGNSSSPIWWSMNPQAVSI